MKAGKVSENVLKRSVLGQVKQKRKEMVNGAGIGVDCAVFSFSEGENPVTCVQEAAAPSEGGTDWLAYLVVKCANNLAAAGAEPVAVSLALLLPETVQEPELRQLMKRAEETGRSLGIAIAGGQTSISPALSVPVAVASGIGKLMGKKDYSAKAAAPGQDIVLSKWIGLEGTALLTKKHRDRILERYPAYLVEEAAGLERYLSVLPEAATAVKSGVCAMHDASEGGIFGALWELAEGAGVGLTIDLKKLPLRQETVEVCEQCNANPYELLSGGCLVMTAQDGFGLVEALQAQHIPAVVVGKITDSNDRIIRNEDEVRYMERAQQDQIFQNI